MTSHIQQALLFIMAGKQARVITKPDERTVLEHLNCTRNPGVTG